MIKEILDIISMHPIPMCLIFTVTVGAVLWSLRRRH